MTPNAIDFEEALRADGEKLLALTGEDHGPFELQPENGAEDPFNEAAYLWEFLKHADGLEVEVLYHIINDLKRGESLASAIWHARCEWDI